MENFSVHEFSYVRLQIFFSSVHFYLLQFLFGITRKKNCFSFTGYLICVSVRYYKKKNCFSFTDYLNLCFCSVLQGKKNCYSFFSDCIISVTGYTNFCFCFWITDNNKTAVFPVSVVFKLFEDCSFSVSIVLKYLFLYSNIFHFYTAVLHSKYLLHIYIQIFVNRNGFAFDSD